MATHPPADCADQGTTIPEGSRTIEVVAGGLAVGTASGDGTYIVPWHWVVPLPGCQEPEDHRPDRQ